jgi:endonuclease III
MRHPSLPLRAYIDRLRTRFGRPKRPIPSGPFEWIIWEHVASAPDDEQRAVVFRTLRQRIGTTPQAILRTPKPKMLELLGPGGSDASARLARLREAAELMIEIGLARVRTLVREAPAEAKKLLKRFKGIGEPGADRILLFCRTQATLAPDANGLRVLQRLGYGKAGGGGGAGGGGAAAFRQVSEAVAPELPRDYNWLIQAHQLLRRHGQEICRPVPRCDVCPLAPDCAWYRRGR